MPTVYATLDTRHARAHAHVLRHAHSQVSLNNVVQDTALDQGSSHLHLAHGQDAIGHDVTCAHHPSRSYPQDMTGDLAQPLLSDEAADADLLDKRESSV